MSEWNTTIAFLIGLSFSIVPFYALFKMGFSFKNKGYWQTDKYIYWREKKNA